MIKLLQGTDAAVAATNQTPQAIAQGAETAQTGTTQQAPGKNQDEQAEEKQQAQGGGYGFWIMIIAMIAIMYFFMWRPEKKRRKEMQQFRDGLKAGDKVITAGGIYAVVKKVEETSLLIEVDSNVTLRIDKNMVIAAPEK